jgi:hypothetical protein
VDDVLVCRGLCRVLQPGGSFFVIMGAFEVADDHPLSFILETRSVLGHKSPTPFATQVEAQLKRLTLLFDALDAPDVHRVDPAQPFATAGTAAARIVPAGVWLYRQHRPLGLVFACAFLTPEHIAATGQPAHAFWQDIEARCATASQEAIAGTYEWALLQFRRSGTHVAPEALAPRAVLEIGYEAPSATL